MITKRFWDLLGQLGQKQRRLVGLALLRIGLGLAALEFYLSDYAHRAFFWGPDSYYTFAAFKVGISPGQLSLYAFSRSDLWFELVFNAGIAVAIAFTIVGGRWLTALHALFLLSLYLRNPQTLQGGDNLARILLIFMIFTTTDAYFSPLASRRRAKLSRTDGRFTAGATLHNTAAFLIVFQVATVYFIAGLWKIIGKVWYDGSAMYYITRIDEFAFSHPLAMLMKNPFATTFVSYYTIAVEISFPILILSRRAWLRKTEVMAVEALHFGIILSMGLLTFGLIMLSADCSALRDSDYHSLAKKVNSFICGTTSRIRHTARDGRKAPGAVAR